MFGEKCVKCGKKISKQHSFCPYCGCNVKREREEKDYGLLGRTDELDSPLDIRMPFGFNRIFSSLIKQIDKQFRELDKEMSKEIKKPLEKSPKFKTSGVSISISTGTGKKPEIKVRGFGPEFGEVAEEIKDTKTRKTKLLQPEITEEKARKLAKLPKQEAETTVRRLSNKIVYEINLPRVKSLRDVIINQLENSIEIKAFSEDKVYFKLLPIALPILNYKLQKEKLVIELKAKD
jgi:rRNA maturation endonuclease Nob1